jgi:hypothetical protein
VRRIYHRLLDEHGMADVSYQVVRTYVADRKPKIRAEAGRGPINMFFPETHRPGAKAEVDFGLEVFYCQPGIEGAHEKGGVEGQIGWFRRNHRSMGSKLTSHCVAAREQSQTGDARRWRCSLT